MRASMMRTTNPALRAGVFTQQGSAEGAGQMTITGTINRTGMLLLMLMAAALWSWNASFVSSGQEWGGMQQTTFQPTAYLWVGLIGGLIAALVTIFKKEWSGITAPVYAVFEGLFLGAISAGFEASYPGIVFNAMVGTFGTLFALLAIYRSGIIQVTDNFRMGVAAATGAVFFIYLISLVLNMFGMSVPYIHGSGLFGIGFSVAVIIIAALNLVLDFDFIEQGAQAGAPKYMEWFGAFGLLVTLVWLYIEILRLLSKLRER